MKMLAVILISVFLLALMVVAPLAQIMANQPDTATIAPGSTSNPPIVYQFYLPLVRDSTSSTSPTDTPLPSMTLTPTIEPTPLLPDLEPYCCDVQNSCAGPGSVSGTVRNNGSGDAGESTVYLFYDPWGNEWDDIKVIPGLAANNSVEIFWEFDVPNYYFLLRADVDNQVAESNELNNESEWYEPTGTPCGPYPTPIGQK